MILLYLVGAVFFICVAHYIRVLRWELFINIYEKPNRKTLVQGLNIGFLLNYIVPFKLGDLIRAGYVGRKMKNGSALALSTVIVDRYLDIVCVGLIFIMLSVSGKGGNEIRETAVFYICLTLTVSLLMVMIYVLKTMIKRIIRQIASLFNKKIEALILQIAWALIWNFKDIFQKISKIKLVVTTMAMWFFYLVSYFLFAKCLSVFEMGTNWTDIFVLLFAQNGIKESTGAVTLFTNYVSVTHFVCMIGYMLAPLVVMLLISFFIRKGELQTKEENYLNLLPHMDPKECLNFLESYFSDSNREYVKNYLKINQNISIVRDYSAGSNATTMLCMDEKSTFFRKYAFGKDGEKLYQQILWLRQNENRLVLPRILRQEKTDTYCYYDMPYSSSSVGLFEYAHSMPIEQTWKVIRGALECLEKSIYMIDVRNADEDIISSYIRTKVEHNLEKVKNAKRIKSLLHYDTLIINGVEYKNLRYFERYLTEDYLTEVFKNDKYAVIHGDLTIENIICTRNEQGKDDFYIIDPNTGNMHDSPNLDYGKLLQSIHGGYEFLMSTKDINVNENQINFLFTRSSAYTELHKKLREYMLVNFGHERTRSIYFHEIIHWLRLMPYKIEKDGKRALLFYAGMLMVMNDVIEMYGSKEI